MGGLIEVCKEGGKQVNKRPLQCQFKIGPHDEVNLVKSGWSGAEDALAKNGNGRALYCTSERYPDQEGSPWGAALSSECQLKQLKHRPLGYSPTAPTGPTGPTGRGRVSLSVSLSVTQSYLICLASHTRNIDYILFFHPTMVVLCNVQSTRHSA